MRLVLVLVALAVLAWGAVEIVPGSAPSKMAWARPPEDVFGGQVLVLKDRLPNQFRSAGAFVEALRRAKIRTLWADREGADKGKWKFEYMIFFRRPLDDLEVTVRFYDITHGTRRFLAEASTFMQRRGERMFGSSMTLEPPQFEPNKKILITAENRGRLLASGELIIRGETPRNTGNVKFSDDEAKSDR